ncbi:MAG: hypothetical protein QXD13_02395 [Candidatus Pacearchaeota archaeon]
MVNIEKYPTKGVYHITDLPGFEDIGIITYALTREKKDYCKLLWALSS